MQVRISQQPLRPGSRNVWIELRGALAPRHLTAKSLLIFAAALVTSGCGGGGGDEEATATEDGRAAPLASSSYATANDGLFIGNSQITACGGNLVPLKTFHQVQGLTINPTQLQGAPSFQLQVGALPAALPMDFVALVNRMEDWDAYGYAQNLAWAKSVHTSIVGRGSRTVLWMSYMVGIGPANSTHKNTIVNYWKRLQTDLENVVVNGSRRDVLLIPVLELWELGKVRLPYNSAGASCKYARGFQTDDRHATEAGQYAVGVLVSTFLSCKDPRKSDSAPFPSSYKQWVKDTVWSLLNGPYRPSHCAGSS